MSDQSKLSQIKATILRAAAALLEDAVQDGSAEFIYTGRGSTSEPQSEEFLSAAKHIIQHLSLSAAELENFSDGPERFESGTHLWWYELPGEDWFVKAPDEQQAATFIENSELCGPQDYQLRHVSHLPDDLGVGWPEFEELAMFGAEILRAKVPYVVRINGQHFVQGTSDWQVAKSWDDLFEDQGLGRPNGTRSDNEEPS